MQNLISRVFLLIVVLFLGACSTIETYRDQGLTFSSNPRGVSVGYSQALFIKGSPEFTPVANAYFDSVVRLLNNKPKRYVLIDTEYEKIGSAALNYELYEVRSLSLMKALVDRGIDNVRLAFVSNPKAAKYPSESRLIFLDEDIRDFKKPAFLR